MCRIWERKRDEEITPVQLAAVLSDPLFGEIEQVGMNGGEPTLRLDLPELAEVLIAKLPRLRGLSLITNAIREKRVIAAIEELGKISRRRGKRLDVMVSLDGVGDVHDRVRGVPGNFESAMKVLDYLQTSQVVDSFRVGCTIIAENAYGIEEVLALMQKRGVYARFRLGVPHPRLYSAGLKEPFSLSEEQVFHVASFLDALIHGYEMDEGRRAFYASLRNQLTEAAPRSAGCAWRNHAATLGPRGELSYCAVASPVLGNAKEASASGLYWGNQDVLDGILASKCADCRHDYEGVSGRGMLVKRWIKRVVRLLPERAGSAIWGGWAQMRDQADYWGRKRRYVRVGIIDKTSGPLRILLCGWYGTETLGDRAILAGLCRLIREITPDAVIDVASLNPYVTRETRRLMPEMGLGNVLSLAVAKSSVAEGCYQAVAVAGGPMMTPVREVIDLCELLELEKRVGGRTAILGCGLGPITQSGPRFAAIREMVSMVRVCVLRDRASVRQAAEFRCTQKIEASLDPAWFWSALSEDQSVADNGRGGVLRIAMALRDWPVKEYAGGLSAGDAQAIKTRFEAELIHFVEELEAAGRQVELVPVCMHTIAAGGDDRAFYHRLFAGRDELLARVPWKRRTPVEETELLRGADAVLAMRFHSCVFALALGKPMLGIDYTRGGKVGALLVETGNADRLLKLDDFDGREAARRLLADGARDCRPNQPRRNDYKSIYLDAIKTWLDI
jgi:polysaccharide pyruvyl transferase WcaK-like protein/MoaA/NifB/PqqE/SkfB family radical SAM enzyme